MAVFITFSLAARAANPLVTGPENSDTADLKVSPIVLTELTDPASFQVSDFSKGYEIAVKSQDHEVSADVMVNVYENRICRPGP